MSATAQLVRNPDQSLRLNGELVYATVPDLLEQGLRSLGETQDLMIDLGGVTRVDSAALALMLEWMGLCESQGCTIQFRNVPQEVMAIAGLSNVEELLPLAGG